MKMCRLAIYLVIVFVYGHLSWITEGAAPVFTWPTSDGSTVVTIDENDETAGARTLGQTLTASDADGDALTFTTTSTLFEIVSPARIQQKASSKFDFESGTTSYTLTIQVTDGTTPVTTTLTVNIDNVNDETPVITGTCAATIPEEQAVGTQINIGCTAADGDNGDSLTYQLSGSHSSYFQVDSSTGQFSNVKRLDFEATPTLTTFNQLTLTVKDSANHQTTASVTITLTDTNDNTPICNPSVYFASVTETASTGHAVTSLTCSDADSGNNAAITYSSDSNKFTVDTSGGIALKTAAALDYETATSYTVKVTMVDGGSPKRTGTATVFVTVTNVNDNDPTWGTFNPAYTSATTPYDVSENSPLGTTIVTAAATDPDGNAVTFSIVSVTANDGSSGITLFRVDSAGGALQTLASLDRDAPNGKSYYDVIIRATDSGGTVRSIDRTIRVGITDYNDNAPKYALSLYSVTIAEGATVGSSVLQLVATDGDTSSSLSYAISNGNSANKFEFSSTTANLLQVKTVIDLDASSNDPDSYTLVVTVKDGGSPELTGTSTVYVSVTSSNDHTPVFGATTPTGTITIAETAAVGTSVAKVAATDNDHGKDGVIAYSITGGDTSNNFQVDPSSGIIRTKKPFANPGTVTLSVKAQDGGSTPKSVTTSVVITVSDVNNNSPVCSPFSHALNVAEDKAVNYQVVKLTCSDADTSNTLTYSINSGNADSKFAVSGSGAITLAAVLDYDSSVKSYSLVIRVSDGTNHVDVPVSVTVTAVNEATPTFVSNPTVTTPENAAINSKLTTYTATDNDHSPHNIQTYEISSVTNNGANTIIIDQATGDIKLAKSLDYENVQKYAVTVVATDGGGLKGTGTVTVSVTDVNDNTPTCNPASWNLQTPENAGSLPLTLVSSLGCTDADGSSPNKDITYSLVQTPSGSGEFAVSSSGVVTLTKALNFESTSFYTIGITAKDGGPSPGLSTVVPITVSVTDVNDGAPTFSGSFNVNLTENVAIGTLVSDVVATDPDGSSSTYGKLSYAITSGNTGNHFQVNPNTGRVSVAANLDRETTDSYALVITATEASGDNTATTTLTATVTDVNDNFPVFNPASHSVSVLESASVGSQLLQVTASDEDQGVNSQLTLSIVSGNSAGKFSMTNDKLFLAAALDYETTSRYTLNVRAADGGSPSLNTNIVVAVNVLNKNEFAPVFSSSGNSVSLPESTPVGTSVFKATATDQDSGSDGDIRYVIVSGNNPDGTPFFIDPVSGDIKTNSFLDFDTAPTNYTLNVTATDNAGQGANALASSVIVTITLQDVNDNPPVCSKNTYQVSANENATIGDVIANLTATDADSLTNSQFTFAIDSGDGVSTFSLQSTTGVLTLSKTLNYEEKTEYTLAVKVSDQGTPSLYSICYVKITVIDINDNAPEFTVKTLALRLTERQPVGTLVGNVYASDKDSGANADLDYTQMSSKNKFSINKIANNQIQVLTKIILDREQQDKYTFTIEAVDKGTPPLTGTTTIKVYVDDVNDNDPQTSGEPFTASITEDSSLYSYVLTINATDNDVNENGRVTFGIISGNDKGHFSLGADSGILQTATSPLDRETDSVYTLVINVTDHGTPSRSMTTTATVSILDINDNTPAFNLSSYTFDVIENTVAGTSVGEITATDPDAGENAVLTYSFVKVLSGKNLFAIDGSSGELKVVTPPDREDVGSHAIQYMVSDNGSPRLTAVVTVTLTILDRNDNSPVFTQATYSCSVTENSGTGVSVTRVSATDKDLGENGRLAYSISPNLEDGAKAVLYFSVDNVTGVITTIQNIDREQNAFFNFVVIATDQGTPSLLSQSNVRVTVSDVNDNNPEFIPTAFYNAEIPADEKIGGVIINAQAMDKDEGKNAELTFVFQTNTYFVMKQEQNEGKIEQAENQFPSSNQRFILNLTATDKGSTPRSTTATVRIDTFTSSQVVVDFYLNVKLEVFRSNISEFLNGLKQSIAGTYPNAVVKLYDSKTRQVVTKVQSTSRRLLQNSNTVTEDYTTASVYVLCDNSTDGSSSASKCWIRNDQLLSIWTKNSEGTPGTAITGTSSLEQYRVASVHAHPEAYVTPWIETPTGIAVVTVSCILFVLLIVVVVILIVWWKRKKRPVTPSKIDVQETTGSFYDDEDGKESDEKKHPMPSVLTLPLPVSGQTVAVNHGMNNGANSVYYDKNVWHARTNSMIILEDDKSVNQDPAIAADNYDKRTVDPKTGMTYEYDSKTNRRRWVRSADPSDDAKSNRRFSTPVYKQPSGNNW